MIRENKIELTMTFSNFIQVKVKNHGQVLKVAQVLQVVARTTRLRLPINKAVPVFTKMTEDQDLQQKINHQVIIQGTPKRNTCLLLTTKTTKSICSKRRDRSLLLLNDSRIIRTTTII